MTSGQPSNAGLKKGQWSAEEDSLLINYVIQHGEGNWNAVQTLTGLARCGTSCRLRWNNYLRPDLKKGEFTPDEEAVVARLHRAIGNKWSLIAAQLPGRSNNEIKNYWSTRVKRRQRAGIPLYSPEIPDLQYQQQTSAADGQYPVPNNIGAVPMVMPLGMGSSAEGMAPPTATPVGYGMMPVMPPQTEVLPTFYATAEGNPSREQMEGNWGGIEGSSNGVRALETDQAIQDDIQTLIDMITTPSSPAPIPDWYADKDIGGHLSSRGRE